MTFWRIFTICSEVLGVQEGEGCEKGEGYDGGNEADLTICGGGGVTRCEFYEGFVRYLQDKLHKNICLK